MSAEEGGAPKRAKRQPTGDYETGYCRPPKHGQCQKGAPSKNPRGRPTKPKTPDAIIEGASRAMVSITHNGKKIKVTRFEAMVRKLYADAFTGDRKAQAELLRMRLQYARKRPTKTDDDDGVIETFTLMIGDLEEPETPKRTSPAKPRSSMRRRKNETRREIFNRIAALMVTVKDGGVRKRVTFEQALWDMLYAASLARQISATRLINRYTDPIIDGDHSRSEAQSDDGEAEVHTLDLGRLPGLDDDEEDGGNDPEPDA